MNQPGPSSRQHQVSDVSVFAAQAWQEVLRCDPPAEDTNFFELGGHSLAGARVMNRLREHIGIRLSVRVLFDHPVFHEFVAALARFAGSDPPSPTSRKEPVDGE